MYWDDGFASVMQAVEVIVAEATHFPLSLRIVHRFRPPGVLDCASGEEVFAIFVLYRGRECQLRLSLAARLLLDYLARNRHVAQSGTQIAAGIESNDFYRLHASNGHLPVGMLRCISRSAVKVYIARLRLALQLACKELGVRIDPSRVIIGERTVANEIGYKLRATVEWVHIDLARHDRRPLW